MITKYNMIQIEITSVASTSESVPSTSVGLG